MMDLKPCPFCGGKAAIVRACKGWKDYPQQAIIDTWLVECQSCKSSTRSYEDTIYRNGSGELIVEADGVAMAAAAWNRRQPVKEAADRG